MKILLVSNNYPTKYSPHNGVFVRNAVNEMIKQGSHVSVLAPVSRLNYIKNSILNFSDFIIQDKNVSSKLYTSMPLSLLPSKKFFALLNDRSMSFTLNKQRSKFLNLNKYDVCYAHFLPSGRASLRAFPDLPCFLSMGESDPWLYDDIYGSTWIDDLNKFRGIFTVSKSLKAYICKRNPKIINKIYSTPNGVDTSFFKPIPKEIARKKLNLDQDINIAIFIGNFEARKGPLKVLKACERQNIYSVFLGSGSQKLRGEKILYQGRVLPEKLKLWLAASDCFVLPSLSEGRSNAILEALAMGRPCVVSDLNFNREFLDENTAIFVNPASSESIANGISMAIDKNIDNCLGKISREYAESLSQSARIKKIINIMKDRGLN